MAKKKSVAKPPQKTARTTCPPTRNWIAWIDKEPPGPRRLFVQGEVQVPTPCHTAVLSGHEPPGFNPNILLLDLSIVKSPGICIQLVTWIPVRYERVLAKAEPDYGQVTILYAGQPCETVDVQIIH